MTEGSEKEIQNRVGQEKEAFLVNYKLLTSQNIDLIERVRKVLKRMYGLRF